MENNYEIIIYQTQDGETKIDVRIDGDTVWVEMDNAIKRAEATLDYLSHDKKAYALYQARENALHERANMISTAKTEGKFEVARNMYLAGENIAKISQYTKISVEELKRELEKEE